MRCVFLRSVLNTAWWTRSCRNSSTNSTLCQQTRSRLSDNWRHNSWTGNHQLLNGVSHSVWNISLLRIMATFRSSIRSTEVNTNDRSRSDFRCYPVSLAHLFSTRLSRKQSESWKQGEISSQRTARSQRISFRDSRHSRSKSVSSWNQLANWICGRSLSPHRSWVSWRIACSMLTGSSSRTINDTWPRRNEWWPEKASQAE